MIEPVPMLSDQDQIPVRVRCTDCDGRGYHAEPTHCQQCQRVYTASELERPDGAERYGPPWPMLPCHHNWMDLTASSASCLMCVGTGWIEQRVNLGAIFQALQAWQEAHQTPAPVALPSRPRTRRAATKVSA